MKKTFLIVFCGMDGTGKSTLAQIVSDYLRLHKIPFHYKHAHGYAISQGSFAINEAQIEKYKFFFSLMTPVAILDNFINYFFHYKEILKYKTLISDRYFYDKVARMLFYGVINKTIAKIFLYILPKPDLLFVLDADPKTVLSRKAEYSLNEFERFREVYKFIAESIGVSLITTNVSLRITEDLITKKVEKLFQSPL